jgi:membrane-associated phospholipid phosphatase
VGFIFDSFLRENTLTGRVKNVKNQRHSSRITTAINTLEFNYKTVKLLYAIMTIDSLKIHTINTLEKFGDVGQYTLPGLVGGYALISGHPTQALAFGVLGYVQKLEVFAIKKHFPRERPVPYVVGKISQEDTESFPSSHTGGAFLAVGLSLGLYGPTSPITITSTALALLVGASRYLSKKHWLSDVLGGALIGTVHGLAAAHCRF